MAEQTRGSQKLLLQRCGRTEIGEEELARFLKVIDFEGIKICNVYCKGQPRPDVITGSLQVTRDAVDKLANRLFNFKELRLKGLEVFPYGIPVLDEAFINFEVVQAY